LKERCIISLQGATSGRKYSSYKTYIAKSESALVTNHLVLGLMKHHNRNANNEYRVFVENAIGIGIDNPSKNIYGGMIPLPLLEKLSWSRKYFFYIKS